MGSRHRCFFSQGIYFLFSLIGFALVVALRHRIHSIRNTLKLFDALGLAAFTVLGTELALQSGIPGFAALILGLVSATVGGMIRDVLRSEVPIVLRREVYAVASLVGAAVYLWLTTAGLGTVVAATVGFLATLTVRLVSLLYRWRLPTFTEEDW